MSFGVSFGDIKNAFELAQKLRERWKDGPSEYASICSETENLSSILGRISEMISEGGLKPHHCQDLERAGRSCLEALRPLDALILKHSALQSSQNASDSQNPGFKQRFKVEWHRFRFDPDDVRHNRDRLQGAVNALNVIYNSIILDKTSTLCEKVAELCNTENERQRALIVKWFAPANFAAHQNDIFARRHQGTNAWFLKTPKYCDWRHNPGSTILCNGAPGSGKTVMAATIIDDLRRRFAQEKNVVVVYHYCNFNRPNEQTYHFILASLVGQLFEELPSVPKIVSDIFKQHQSRHTKPLESDLQEILITLTADYSRVFLVIDGLDESPSAAERSKLLTSLPGLEKYPCETVSVCLTSRDLPEITWRFSESTKIEIRAQDQDVKNYLTARLPELETIEPENQSFQREIVDRILEASNGMFLLAKLLFNALEDKMTMKAVRNTLEDLSRGAAALRIAYSSIRNRIDRQAPGRRRLAIRVLYWMTYARRELLIDELQEAVAIEPGKHHIDPEEIVKRDQLVSVCAGLVIVDRQSNIVRLVHKTAQEYLYTVREEWLPNGHEALLTCCLAYLSMDNVQEANLRHDAVKGVVTRHKLLIYAASNWGHHSSKTRSQSSNHQVLQLLRREKQLSLLSEILFDGFGWIYQAQEVSAAHLVSFFPIPHIAKILFQEGGKINEKDEWGRTSLMWAATYNNIEMVRVLLSQNDIDVNLKDNDGNTALSWAAAISRPEIVEILLRRRDIKVNTQNSIERTPLLYAIRSGNFESALLLLSHDDIDMDSCDRNGWNAILYAIDRAAVTVVQRLLDRGANPRVKLPPFNRKMGNGSNLRLSANPSKRQHFLTEIASLLLNNGISLKVKDKEGTYRRTSQFLYLHRQSRSGQSG